MRPQTYRVELSKEERRRLLLLVRQGVAPARVILRAHILLHASEGAYDHEIAHALHTHPATVLRTRRRFAEEGLEHALHDRSRPGPEPKLDVTAKALLIALANTDPPKGHDHWTMQLLAERLMELGIVSSISGETVRRALEALRRGRS